MPFFSLAGLLSGFLKASVPLPLAAAAVLFLAGWGGMERLQLVGAHNAQHSAEKAAQQARNDTATCQANEGKLKAALNSQSANIKAESAADQARQATAKQALAAQRAATAKLQGAISKLSAERAKVGETPAQACGRILRDGIGAAPQ